MMGVASSRISPAAAGVELVVLLAPANADGDAVAGGRHWSRAPPAQVKSGAAFESTGVTPRANGEPVVDVVVVVVVIMPLVSSCTGQQLASQPARQTASQQPTGQLMTLATLRGRSLLLLIKLERLTS